MVKTIAVHVLGFAALGCAYGPFNSWRRGDELSFDIGFVVVMSFIGVVSGVQSVRRTRKQRELAQAQPSE